MGPSIVVRCVEPPDLLAVSRLAGRLVGYHRDLDPRRFMTVEHVEEGYARFLAAEASRPEAVVLCAARAAEVVGYAYARMEGRNWNALLDAHGALHDLFVLPSARRQGVGASLALEACRRLEAKGAPRVVLHTAVQNREAQALFAKLGFRSTMMEMTREAASGA